MRLPKEYSVWMNAGRVVIASFRRGKGWRAVRLDKRTQELLQRVVVAAERQTKRDIRDTVRNLIGG